MEGQSLYIGTSIAIHDLFEETEGMAPISIYQQRVGISRNLEVRNGEAAMSSRAVNPELLKALWDFNHKPEHWTIKPYAPQPRSGTRHDLQNWGGGRARRLLQAIYALSFWCLLRFDEVLKVQFHDLEVISSTCIKLSLPFRKTDQFGGTSVLFIHISRLY
jgi:hypothetical protein